MTSFQYLMSTTIPPGKTGSRLITEVKSGWAKLVLVWVTAWEYFVLYTFHFSKLRKICLQKTENYRFLGKK